MNAIVTRVLLLVRGRRRQAQATNVDGASCRRYTGEAVTLNTKVLPTTPSANGKIFPEAKGLPIHRNHPLPELPSS